jgi:hypothetical protein
MVMQRDYAHAVEVLQRIPFQQVPDPWRNESRWNLYVALQGEGRASRADSLLETMAKEPGPIGQRARNIQQGG